MCCCPFHVHVPLYATYCGPRADASLLDDSFCAGEPMYAQEASVWLNGGSVLSSPMVACDTWEHGAWERRKVIYMDHVRSAKRMPQL